MMLIFSSAATQVSMLAGVGEPGDVAAAADDGADGAPWLPQAVITSPHAAATRALMVAVRP
jgi:hypothetical protein